MHPRTPHHNPHDAPWLLPRPWTRTLQVTPGTTDSWDVVDGEDKGLGHRSNFVPTCLGCGWRPRSAQMTVLTPGEYWANPAGYGKCTRCFAKGDLPPSWFVSRHGSGKPSGANLPKAAKTEAEKGRGQGKGKAQRAKARASGQTHGPSRTPKGKPFAGTTT